MSVCVYIERETELILVLQQHLSSSSYKHISINTESNFLVFFIDWIFLNEIKERLHTREEEFPVKATHDS